MDKLLKDLRANLNTISPAFLHVPPHTSYPYITLELGQSLKGLPWGPSCGFLTIKVWSRYNGMQEVLDLARKVEECLEKYGLQSSVLGLKIMESALIFLNDCQTRVHTFRVKARTFAEINHE